MHKASLQALTPSLTQANAHFKVPQTILARVQTPLLPPPYGQCPNAFALITTKWPRQLNYEKVKVFHVNLMIIDQKSIRKVVGLLTIFWAVATPYPQYIPSPPYILLSLKPPFGKEQHRVIMEQNLKSYDSVLKGANGKILKKGTEQIIKSNKCYNCDYASSDKTNLRRHSKTHKGEKLNKCNQCDYACSRTGKLRIHLKTHSGEKSNKCNECDFASSDPSSLRRHLKRHKPV